jgi:hypothetical protein
MRVYPDLCCLKRPFDDQTQPRIHAESEAILAILIRGLSKMEFVQTPALHLENEQNPVFHRANWVREWLNRQTALVPPDEPVAQRTAELMQLGFKNFDAFQLASAELTGANLFVSCDDRLVAAARRNADRLRVEVKDLLSFTAEVLP